MAYCTQSDIEKRISAKDLIILADQDGDGASDAPVVANAIASADALINSYLSVKYAVPVAAVPGILMVRAVSLSVYFLRLGRDSVTDDVRAQYKDDIAWLESVVKGTVNLGVAPKPAESAGAPGVEYTGDERVFKRSDWL